MPKSFLSDDPFAAALDHSRQNRRFPFAALLIVPALGLTLMAFGLHARSHTGVSILAADVQDESSRSEGRAGQLVSIEQARRNVSRWQQESCGGAATPHSRAKLRAWQQNYRNRLILFARMYGQPNHSQ